MMDFIWVIGIIVFFSWKLHKRYPGVVLMFVCIICIILAGCFSPLLFIDKNSEEAELWGCVGCAISICLIYPFIKLYLHFLPFCIKNRWINDEIEKIIRERKVKVKLHTPNDEEIKQILCDSDFIEKHYERYFKKFAPQKNPLVDPESPFYYKTSWSVRQNAIDELRRRERKKIDDERDDIEASCMEEIEEKRWFKKKKECGEQFANPYDSMPFADMVTSRVQSISPTDQQLANFMSNIYVPGLSGKMTRYTVDEWLCMFSKLPEKKDEALILWRDECARRIISSGKWPDGFHE